jgi:hypothetical protein
VTFHEYIGSLHVHTIHSDGTADYPEVASLAGRVGLDFVIVTDHNVLVGGRDGWYGPVLLLVGQEVHDEERQPQANHYLAFNIVEDVAHLARDPQALIEAVAAQGGLGFIAHPFERGAPQFGEAAIPWLAWEVRGYTGLAIWNYMSEFKGHLSNLAQAVFLAHLPGVAIRGPYPETLARWDALLKERKVVAIGTTDAHAKTYHLGPLSRKVFSYEYLFRTIRTHVLSQTAFLGAVERDKRVVYEALKKGHCFVAYDLLGQSRGFRFTARSGGQEAIMGDEIALRKEVCLEVFSPLPADLRLLGDGRVVAQTKGRTLQYVTEERGVYRVEAYRSHLFRKRGWVFSNPIYVSQ